MNKVESTELYALLEKLITLLAASEAFSLAHLNQKVQGERSNHHRRARCFGGTDSSTNLVSVDPRLHAAWHALFGPGEPRTVEQLLNALWLDPGWRAVLVRRQDTDSLRHAVRALNKIAGPTLRVYIGRNVSKRCKRQEQTLTAQLSVVGGSSELKKRV